MVLGGHSFIYQNVTQATDESVPLELKGGLYRSERTSRDRRCCPKEGFVSKLSPSFLRDTWIMTSINHCRVTTIVNNKNDIY